MTRILQGRMGRLKALIKPIQKIPMGLVCTFSSSYVLISVSDGPTMRYTRKYLHKMINLHTHKPSEENLETRVFQVTGQNKLGWVDL